MAVNPGDEISALLDQCSQDELASILQAIEGDELVTGEGQAQVDSTQTTKEKMKRNLVAGYRNGELQSVFDSFQEEAAPTPFPTPAHTDSAMAPVPPSSPPKPGNSKRPVPGGYKRAEAEAPVSVGEMQRMLEEHSNGILSEVRRLIPTAQPDNAITQASQSGVLSLEMLTSILAQRDQEVKSMEDYLAELQGQLQEKDQRVADLGAELEGAFREVRHRQLDLEFQQLKLEERVRTNAELEQAQRNLLAQVDEASLNSRHAALEVDLGRKSPRSARVQGSLPWMLRKNRQPWERYDAMTLTDKSTGREPGAAV
jgi:hypothetical protein